jgi:flagellar biogenesis protein FliO
MMLASVTCAGQDFTARNQQPGPSIAAADGARAERTASPLIPPKTSENAPQRISPPSRNGEARPSGGMPSLVTMFASLALVLGIFFLVAWGMKRGLPAGAHLLPNDVVEVLGRAPLAGRQQVHLLRLGNKLILVSATPSGAETLTEVTDAAEVERLQSLCRQAQPNSASATFRHIFQQFGREKPARGFLGADRSQLDLARTSVPSAKTQEDADDV